MSSILKNHGYLGKPILLHRRRPEAAFAKVLAWRPKAIKKRRAKKPRPDPLKDYYNSKPPVI